jgi:heme/copper-type cytochrome/quinol oxidase subunit 2
MGADPARIMSRSTSELVFWIATVLCIIAELAILRAAFAPHAHTDTPAPIPHSPRGTEMVWAVIPAIILGVLLAATWRAIH